MLLFIYFFLLYDFRKFLFRVGNSCQSFGVIMSSSNFILFWSLRGEWGVWNEGVWWWRTQGRPASFRHDYDKRPAVIYEVLALRLPSWALRLEYLIFALGDFHYVVNDNYLDHIPAIWAEIVFPRLKVRQDMHRCRWPPGEQCLLWCCGRFIACWALYTSMHIQRTNVQNPDHTKTYMRTRTTYHSVYWQTHDGFSSTTGLIEEIQTGRSPIFIVFRWSSPFIHASICILLPSFHFIPEALLYSCPL